MRGKSAREMTEAEVRDIAVRYLSRREYGIEELRRKLLQRGAKPDIVEQLVSNFAEQNLVSDERFTEMYVRTRMRRLFGPLKIRGELRQRGIADHLISEAMQLEDDAWIDAAALWAERRIRVDLDFAARAKIHRSLMNRGFNHEQASVSLSRVLKRLNSSD